GLDPDRERAATLTVANPLSDEQPLLRTRVLTTLVEALHRNVSRGAKDVALFEVGLVVQRSGVQTSAPTVDVGVLPGEDVLARIGLPERTVAGELDLDVLTAASSRPVRARTLSSHPLANTDVALVVDEAVPAARVAAALRSGAGDTLEELTLFDVYRGDQVGE